MLQPEGVQIIFAPLLSPYGGKLRPTRLKDTLSRPHIAEVAHSRKLAHTHRSDKSRRTKAHLPNTASGKNLALSVVPKLSCPIAPSFPSTPDKVAE